jgi:hypothetical protein
MLRCGHRLRSRRCDTGLQQSLTWMMGTLIMWQSEVSMEALKEKWRKISRNSAGVLQEDEVESLAAEMAELQRQVRYTLIHPL